MFFSFKLLVLYLRYYVRYYVLGLSWRDILFYVVAFLRDFI